RTALYTPSLHDALPILAQRARIILLASEGMPNRAIAQAVDVSRPTVLLWRARFAAAGVPGLLRERPRPGRKPELSPERIQEVVEDRKSTRLNSSHVAIS